MLHLILLIVLQNYKSHIFTIHIIFIIVFMLMEIILLIFLDYLQSLKMKTSQEILNLEYICILLRAPLKQKNWTAKVIN